MSKGTLSGRAISAFRLARHHLVGKSSPEPAAICADVCGIQAQVMSAAEMALWARNHKLTRAEIHSALWESRTLMKAPLMRGTLHLIAAEDFPLYIAALKTGRIRQTLKIMARYKVSEKEARAVGDAVVEILGSGPMTRREVTSKVLGIAGKKARPWFEQSSWGVARLPMLEGAVCYGPNQGQDVIFVRADHWLPAQKPIGELEALTTLIRRYLRAYGPADSRDFSFWSGLQASDVQPVWASLENEFLAVRTSGKRSFVLSEDSKSFEKSKLRGPVVRLLPNFDAYLLAHYAKDQLVDPRHYKRIFRNQWWISAPVMLDGKLIGIWEYARRKNLTAFTITPFEKVSKSIRDRIGQEAASLAKFLQTPFEVQFQA